MTIKFNIPKAHGTLFIASTAAATYRGLRLSGRVAVSLSDKDDGPGVSLLLYLDGKPVYAESLALLSDEENEAYWDMFFDEHFWRQEGSHPSEAWFKLLEKSLDLYIEKHDIKAEPKEAA